MQIKLANQSEFYSQHIQVSSFDRLVILFAVFINKEMPLNLVHYSWHTYQ